MTFDSDLAARSNGPAGLEIQLRRKAPIEAQLLVTQESPTIERSEIDEGVAHRPLDLVRVVPGEQDPGDVRLDELDPADRMRVSLGTQEARERARQRPICHVDHFTAVTLCQA